MAKRVLPAVQVSQYDKILQENMEVALLGIIKNVLKINAVKSEELSDALQHTRERKPDLLKKITNDKGETFVLHIEFQTRDEVKMVYRMVEYWAMLLRQYEIGVRQYVIYIGEGVPNMPAKLTSGSCYYNYNLVAISTIDYRIFLKSKKPEEKMLAILGNFGTDSIEKVLTRLSIEIVQDAKGNLVKEKRKNQLRMLAQLRT